MTTYIKDTVFPHPDVRSDGSVVQDDWIPGEACSLCGEDIDHGRRRLGAVTCGSCSVHSVHHTHG